VKNDNNSTSVYPRFNPSEQANKPSWLVKNFIMAHGLIDVFGQSYAGKTLFTEDLATCIVNKQSFLGMKTAHGNVLIIDQDTPTDKLTSQLQRFNRGVPIQPFDFTDTEPQSNLYIESMKGYSLTTANQYAYSTLSGIIEKYIETLHPKLIVIDSLHGVCGGLDVNNTNDMNKLSIFKNKIFGKYPDTTIILNHHISEHKNFGFDEIMNMDTHGLSMGNSAIVQQADEILILAPKVFGSKKLVELGIRPVSKRQLIPIDPFIVELKEDKNSLSFTFKNFYTMPEPKINSEIITLFKNLSKKSKKQSLTVNEVYEKLGGLHGIIRVRDAMHFLESEKKLRLITHKPYPFQYVLTEKGYKTHGKDSR